MAKSTLEERARKLAGEAHGYADSGFCENNEGKFEYHLGVLDGILGLLDDGTETPLLKELHALARDLRPEEEPQPYKNCEPCKPQTLGTPRMSDEKESAVCRKSTREVRRLQARVDKLRKSKDVADRITAVLIDPLTAVSCWNEAILEISDETDKWAKPIDPEYLVEERVSQKKAAVIVKQLGLK